MRGTWTISLLALVGVSTSAMCGELELTEKATFTVTELPAQTIVHMDQFDDLAGARLLTEVEIFVSATATLEAAVENEGDTALDDTLALLTGFVQMQAGSLGGFIIASDVAVVPPPGLDASDGVPGRGPDYYDFGELESSGVETAIGTDDLVAFIGGGDVAVVISAATTVAAVPASVLTLTTGPATMSGVVDVVYRYRLTACAADLDDSGSVGFTDLLIVLSEWGRCGDVRCDSDIDNSGDVGFGDLLLVLASWSTTCP